MGEAISSKSFDLVFRRSDEQQGAGRERVGGAQHFAGGQRGQQAQTVEWDPRTATRKNGVRHENFLPCPGTQQRDAMSPKGLANASRSAALHLRHRAISAASGRPTAALALPRSSRDLQFCGPGSPRVCSYRAVRGSTDFSYPSCR